MRSFQNINGVPLHYEIITGFGERDLGMTFQDARKNFASILDVLREKSPDELTAIHESFLPQENLES